MTHPLQSRPAAFSGVLSFLFLASVTVTVLWCNSMSAIGEMPMPGRWTMSMAWMRMPGQTWSAAAVSFAGMWIVMMVAMMLPSLTPALWRCHNSLETAHSKLRGRLTALVGLGYFFVWTLAGFLVFPLGAAAAAIEMHQPVLSRAVPLVSAFVVLIAGALQFTKWKAHHLACCRAAPPSRYVPPAHPRAAWRLGLHLGLHCGLNCANLTAILLVLGVMDLRAMTAVTAAITAERLAPAGRHVARVIGVLSLLTALLLIAKAVRF
jgi:predicted metal-binding membrane protein